jgi:hypothetical protein
MPPKAADELAGRADESPISAPTWLRRGVWLSAVVTAVALALTLLVNGAFGGLFYAAVIVTVLGVVCRLQFRRSGSDIPW